MSGGAHLDVHNFFCALSVDIVFTLVPRKVRSFVFFVCVKISARVWEVFFRSWPGYHQYSRKFISFLYSRRCLCISHILRQGVDGRLSLRSAPGSLQLCMYIPLGVLDPYSDAAATLCSRCPTPPAGLGGVLGWHPSRAFPLFCHSLFHLPCTGCGEHVRWS